MTHDNEKKLTIFNRSKSAHLKKSNHHDFQDKKTIESLQLMSDRF